jgi:hypothetical protein
MLRRCGATWKHFHGRLFADALVANVSRFACVVVMPVIEKPSWLRPLWFRAAFGRATG